MPNCSSSSTTGHFRRLFLAERSLSLTVREFMLIRNWMTPIIPLFDHGNRFSSMYVWVNNLGLHTSRQSVILPLNPPPPTRRGARVVRRSGLQMQCRRLRTSLSGYSEILALLGLNGLSSVSPGRSCFPLSLYSAISIFITFVYNSKLIPHLTDFVLLYNTTETQGRLRICLHYRPQSL